MRQIALEHLLTRSLKLADIPAVLRRRSFAAVRRAFYADLWQRAADNIGATIRVVSPGFFEIRKGGFATFVSRSDIMLDDALTIRVMAHKGLTYRLLAARGLAVPDHLEFSLGNMAKAEEFRNAHPGLVVVKPITGTGSGMGVTTAISSAAGLRRAARYAASFNRKLLVEPHFEGGSYRLLYLDGKYIDAIRRDPPEITGDGQASIRGLIARENTRRRAARPITALHPIIIDGECRGHLGKLGLHLASKPAPGVRVTLKGAVNENAAPQNHCVRDIVDGDTVRTGARLVNDLGVRFAGIDLISDDIAAPFSKGRVIFSEINVNPGIHHHYLVANPPKGVPVAEQILSYLFEQKQGVMDLSALRQEGATG